MYRIDRKRAARTAMHAALAGVFSLTAAATFAAGAHDSGHAPPEHRAGDVDYRVGGIGEREAEAMRALSSEYPLTLTFVERAPDGRDLYTADVGVKISDGDGNTRLDTLAKGPLLLAELPDGHYTVEATLGSDTQKRDVRISNGEPKRVVFSWPLQQPDAREVSRFDR